METYIVRLWRSDAAVALAEEPIRGLVRDVRTGHETRFDSWDALRDVLAMPAAGEATNHAGTRSGGPR